MAVTQGPSIGESEAANKRETALRGKGGAPPPSPTSRAGLLSVQSMNPQGSPRLASSPVALSATPWPDYALVDSGSGRKLERYGARLVARPEPQCLWTPRLCADDWDQAFAHFEPADEDEAGRWRFMGETADAWPMAWRNVRFLARFTAFRHLAVFPEHAANWEWISDRLAARPGARMLNLFGYTGVASLTAAAAGATVTHVDASRRAVGWARENAAVSELAEAPIRWICEDARKWVAREVRRGARYDAILLDPPKFGRGPAGETWRLYEDLPELMAGCAALLSNAPEFLILNAYSERLTGLALANLAADALGSRGGAIDWGELTLAEETGGRAVGLSFFARWSTA
jgi:23S rRNA (cytosine1962-C5)-methyltransferase